MYPQRDTNNPCVECHLESSPEQETELGEKGFSWLLSWAACLAVCCLPELLQLQLQPVSWTFLLLLFIFIYLFWLRWVSVIASDIF